MELPTKRTERRLNYLKEENIGTKDFQFYGNDI